MQRGPQIQQWNQNQKEIKAYSLLTHKKSAKFGWHGSIEIILLGFPQRSIENSYCYLANSSLNFLIVVGWER